MKKIIILLTSCLIAVSSFAQTDKRLKGIEKELNNVLTATKAAGFAVAVVEKNRIIYSKAFGYRDYENQIPADANTLFAIGSCTKAFTSTILGQLEKDGKLSLDDSPIKHIPELTFYNDEMNNGIIIKDLMAHRTGLPRHDYSWYLFPSHDRDSLIARIKHHEPFTGLRKQWYYNNFMFLAQGVIAERITGKTWEENIRERFFKPLGMTSSNLSIAELEKADNAALGYVTKDDKIEKTDYYKIAGMAPAGSINSSVNEMSNWLVAWINGGKYKNQEVIPAGYRTQAMSSQMVVGGGLPAADNPDLQFANYGFGWSMMSYKGHYRVEHGGNIDGFSASTSFFPSDSIGIVVLTNQGGSAIPYLVRNTIADRMLKVRKTAWIDDYIKEQEKNKKVEAEVKGDANRKENTRPSHVSVEYTGEYDNPGYGNFSVFLQNDSLMAEFKRFKLYLNHYHYDVFEPFEVKGAELDSSIRELVRFNFATNEIGDISTVSLKLEAALDPIVFKRTPTTLELDAADLEKYVGEYDLGGVVVKTYVKKENVLYVFVPGQPEYELLAVDKHTFALKIIDGYKVQFNEGDDGKIAELVFIQPNGTFKAKRK